MGCRGRRPLLGALAATLLAAWLSPVPPASAATTTQWDFAARPADMPTTEVPARTLVGGSALHRQAYEASVAVEVDLAAEPDQGTDALLRVVFGELSEAGECVPAWEVSMSTYDPGVAGARDGSRISFTRQLEPYAGGAWDCAFVTLSDPSDPALVHDRLDGAVAGVVVADYAAHVKITDVGHTRLPRGEWSFVRVELENRAADITHVRVDGQGRRLRVREVVVEREMGRGDTVTVRLPVKIRSARPRRLTITTTPRGHDIAFVREDSERVRIEPRG